jgi:hypothetical protein
MAELVSDVQQEIQNSQSAYIHRIKQKDGLRFSQYLEHIDEILAVVIADPEKDNPHSHPDPYDVIDPKRPERRKNIFCNLMTAELFNLHTELIKGNSTDDSAGLTVPDVNMMKEKMVSLRQYLAKGIASNPPLHFIESVRGDFDDKKA